MIIGIRYFFNTATAYNSIMFQLHIVYSLANRHGLFAYVRTCKTRLDATTKLMVVVTSLFNLVISSFPDNLLYHAWTWLVYHGGSNNVQVCSFKPWTVCSNMHEYNHVQAGQLNHVQACQQAKTSCALLRVYLSIFIIERIEITNFWPPHCSWFKVTFLNLFNWILYPKHRWWMVWNLKQEKPQRQCRCSTHDVTESPKPFQRSRDDVSNSVG